MCLQVLLLVALQVVGKGTSYEYNRTIFVSQNGTLNNSCWSEGSPEWPCASLDHALQGAETLSGFVKILIEPGEYTLTESIIFQGKTSLAILGYGSETLIECHPLAGIAFNRSTEILMENLSFVGCGARRLSTSRDFTSSSLPYLHFQVALLFLVSENIMLTTINVYSSNGTGVAFLNVIGDVMITDSMIVDNTANGTGLPGGGGIYVEFSPCITPALNGESGLSNTYNSNATYNITGCQFGGNEASTGEFDIAHHFSRPGCEHQFSFGRGGGLAIFFKKGAKENHISLTNCSFRSNQAAIGGGLQVSIEDGSQNNTVQLASTTFVSNICYKQDVPPSTFSTGGGAALYFLLSPEVETNNNKVIFEFCDFTQNEAYQGGGIALLSTSVDSVLALTNVAEFHGCNFESNVARVGAAVNIFHWLSFPNANGFCATPKFRDCRFCENGGVYTYLQGNVTGSTFATVYVERIPTCFSGSILYYGNKGSALIVQAASIEFASNANINFTKNHGRIGGAMAILGNSWIVVHEETQLTFDSNVGTEKGGAIFVIQTEQHSTAYSHTCFIRYFDPYCPPQNWTSRFIFSNNTAFNQRRNSIHTSSLLSCTWPTSSIESDINRTFCDWKNWKFKDLKPNSTCADEILTSPVKLNTSDSMYKLFPGKSEALHIHALDELKHDVTNQTVFTVSLLNSSTSVNLSLLYVSNDSLTVDGPPKTQASISLETFDAIAVSLNLTINLQQCPPGFVYREKRCNCGGGFHGLVLCKPENFTSYIQIGGCISFNKSYGSPVAAHCPFSAGYQESMEFIKLDYSFCDTIDRNGRLCSKCKAGYGVGVFSSNFKCVNCTESYTNWLRYFATELVPLTIFFLIVLTFHISITSAATNAFIFFSQVISLPFEVLLIKTSLNMLLNRSWLARALSSILVFPYSIWSLDFSSITGPNFCLSQSISVLHILALQYISAVYPLVLSMVAFIIIELHARNFRPVVCLWRPLCLLFVRFRRTWQPKTSTMDAFAAFILLSYTKFVRVSLSLLTPSHVFNDSGDIVDTVLRYDPSIPFFGRAHLPYAILAIFVLLTFGAIPLILLLLYPFRRFQRCLNRYRLLQSPALHMFIDTFQGCYKDGKERCFAGLYFVFRIVIFTIYTSAKSDLPLFFTYLVFAYIGMLVLFVIFQPYKQKFFNCLDVLMIALLVLINSLMLYAYIRLVSHRSFPHSSMVCSYMLMFLPLLYMISYVVYRSLFGSACCKKYCISKSKRTTPEGQPLTQSTGTRRRAISSEVPDRVENPQRYQDMSWSVADTDIDDPLQGDADADEHTSLTVQMSQAVNYGTNDTPTH